MDASMIVGASGAAAGLGGLGMLGGQYKKRRKREEQTEQDRWEEEQYQQALAFRQEVLQGSCVIRELQDHSHRSEGQRQINVMIVGSAAAGMVPGALKRIEAVGCESWIGQILLCEPDVNVRQMCLRSIPPVFHDRITTVVLPMFPGGLGGATVQEVWAQRHYWQEDLANHTQQWIDAIDRDRAITGINPMANFPFISNGGSMRLGQYPLLEYQRHYRTTPAYIASVLDRKDPVRARHSDFERLFGSLGRGEFLLDNRRHAAQNDAAMGEFLAGSMAGTWLTHQHLGPLNLLNYIFSEPGKTATISCWQERLPVFYLPADAAGPAVWYTRRFVTVEKIIRGLEEVRKDAALRSLEFPPAQRKAVTGACVIAPIVHGDLSSDIDAVERRIGEELVATDPNFCIHYASSTAPLTPETKTVPITVVLLQTVAATRKQISRYARGEKLQILAQGAGQNGHHQEMDEMVRTALKGGAR